MPFGLVCLVSKQVEGVGGVTLEKIFAFVKRSMCILALTKAKIQLTTRPKNRTFDEHEISFHTCCAYSFSSSTLSQPLA